MTETNKKTCQFEIKDNHYECPEFALESSEQGYCIFHEPQKDKDIQKFYEGIKRKLSKKDYDFRGYWFPAGISFDEPYIFEGETIFDDCIFKEMADFTGFTFKGNANFGGSTFEGGCRFAESTFEEWANFIECVFQGPTNFESCVFKGDAQFAGSAFEGWTDLAGCWFERWTNFTECTFKREAAFFWSTFKGRTDFAECTFEGYTNFRECTFEGVIYLDHIKIKKPTNMDILFREAKVLWHRGGNYVEEGKAHYQEMDYIRKQKNWFIRYVWANLFHRLLHGYGEKPHRVIFGAAAIITVCALLFMNFSIGETRSFGATFPTYNILKILFKLYDLSLTDLANIGRYFYFSVVTFTTLGYGDLRPVHPISHLISSIEAFVGMFMMALFVLTFGRKWRR